MRIAWSVPTLLIVSFLVFLLVDLSPGDPARQILGPEASAELVEKVRHELHLDQPLLERYLHWLGDVVQGDFGQSLVGGQPVRDRLTSAIPATLSLVTVAMLLAIIGAVLLGAAPMLSSRRTLFDRVSTAISTALLSMPAFWLAAVVVTALAVRRRWFPAVGYVAIENGVWQWFHHLILPALTLAAVTTGELARQLRASLHEVMDTDYVLAAEARGLSRSRIVMRHGFKNAAVPLVTVLGVRTSQLIGSTVVIERIFLVNGIGSLAVNAVLARDIPVVLGVVVVTSILVLVINVLVDASYPYFVPRLRTS